MCQQLKYFLLIFSSAFFILTFLPSSARTQSASGPLPPPVEIILTHKNISESISEITLRMTPLEDMHVDIKCLLLEGLEGIQGNNLMIMPYIEEMPGSGMASGVNYMESVGLLVGPISAGVTKEFVFTVKENKKQAHEIIVHVQALAKWGIKEENFIINVQ